MPDMPGQVATGRDTEYPLSIDDAVTLYARAGHPRTARSIQRYCASGHLDCVKEATSLGEKYFIDAASVARHIAQIEELIALETRATGRELSRHDATTIIAQQSPDVVRPSTPIPAHSSNPPADTINEDTRQRATEPVLSRPVATTDGPASAYVERLEREVEHLKEDKDFLRSQVKTKDEQIAALLERDRETNILVRGLQHMLSPLLGNGRSMPAHDDQSMES